jgi:alpha-beta hydrolase superfamily lysophospholipase
MPAEASLAHPASASPSYYDASVDDVAARPLSWRSDILPDFEAAKLGVAGTRGPTLVRPVRQHPDPRAVVLHVHGYNDYFFQEHLAHTFLDAGLAFYAVDLKRAGRSLTPDDVPHLMHDIKEPGEDLTLAAEAIAELHPAVPLVVHAHSTGGLSAAVWAADAAPQNVAGLALDSPLFGRREHGIQRLSPILLPILGTVRPMMIVSRHPSVYATHLHVDGGGRWNFDTELKRPQGVPARAAWALAVLRAQQRIARGKLTIPFPVLVARAERSGPESADNPLLDEQDIVVDVSAVARLAHRLGPDVEEVVVPRAVHELSLSTAEAREHYLGALLRWIDRVTA